MFIGISVILNFNLAALINCSCVYVKFVKYSISCATSFVNALKPVVESVIFVFVKFVNTFAKAIFPNLFMNGIDSISPVNLDPKTKS